MNRRLGDREPLANVGGIISNSINDNAARVFYYQLARNES